MRSNYSIFVHGINPSSGAAIWGDTILQELWHRIGHAFGANILGSSCFQLEYRPLFGRNFRRCPYGRP